MSKSLEIMNGVAKAMSGPRKPKVKKAMPEPAESPQDESAEVVSETQSPEHENLKMKKPSMKAPKLKMKTG